MNHTLLIVRQAELGDLEPLARLFDEYRLFYEQEPGSFWRNGWVGANPSSFWPLSRSAGARSGLRNSIRLFPPFR